MIWLLISMLACGGKKAAPVVPVVEEVPSDLFLQDIPATVAHLRLRSDTRSYDGPARITIKGDRLPYEVEIEDFDQAQVIEVLVESESPPRFGQAAGDAFKDNGLVSRTDDALMLDIARLNADASGAKFKVVADLAPVAQPPPDDWMAAGTTLYYGRSFDGKPITLVVPMALTVRVGAGRDGSRVLTWKADLDPDTQKIVTGARTIEGRRFVPAEAVESGSLHNDAFWSGEDMGAATSIFVSRAVVESVDKYGGAAFHDLETGAASTLVRVAATDVVVQAGDELWTIPAVIASAHSGKYRYIIARDPENPVLLSAERPGYKMKLMSIGRPAARD